MATVFSIGKDKGQLLAYTDYTSQTRSTLQSNCQCAVEQYHLFMIFAVFYVSLIACRR